MLHSLSTFLVKSSCLFRLKIFSFQIFYYVGDNKDQNHQRIIVNFHYSNFRKAGLSTWFSFISIYAFTLHTKSRAKSEKPCNGGRLEKVAKAFTNDRAHVPKKCEIMQEKLGLSIPVTCPLRNSFLQHNSIHYIICNKT